MATLTSAANRPLGTVKELSVLSLSSGSVSFPSMLATLLKAPLPTGWSTTSASIVSVAKAPFARSPMTQSVPS